MLTDMHRLCVCRSFRISEYRCPEVCLSGSQLPAGRIGSGAACVQNVLKEARCVTRPHVHAACCMHGYRSRPRAWVSRHSRGFAAPCAHPGSCCSWPLGSGLASPGSRARATRRCSGSSACSERACKQGACTHQRCQSGMQRATHCGSRCAHPACALQQQQQDPGMAVSRKRRMVSARSAACERRHALAAGQLAGVHAAWQGACQGCKCMPGEGGLTCHR